MQAGFPGYVQRPSRGLAFQAYRGTFIIRMEHRMEKKKMMVVDPVCLKASDGFFNFYLTHFTKLEKKGGGEEEGVKTTRVVISDP